MQRQSEPRNHHYVSQFHLRNWIVNGHLFEYDKLARTTKSIGLRKAASQYKFNELELNPEVTKKTLNIIEKLSCDEETRAAPFLKDLIKGGFNSNRILNDSDKRQRVARYVAFQMCRSPGMRKTVGDVRSWRFRKIINEALARDNFPPFIGDVPEEFRRFCEKNEMAKLQHFITLFEYTAKLEVLFSSKFAFVLKHDPSMSNQLIISDSPVVDDPETIDYMLPLSPNYAVLLEEGGGAHREEQLGAQDIQRFNTFQLQQGNKIYCTKESIELVRTSIDKNPDWCQTDEQIFARDHAQYQATSHWYELPGVHPRGY
jgi:Protein of unknown function (DUF4238)